MVFTATGQNVPKPSVVKKYHKTIFRKNSHENSEVGIYSNIVLIVRTILSIIIKKENERGENMANSNKLSIYLIKDEFGNDDDMILGNGKELLADIPNIGHVYYRPSFSKPPLWLSSFFGDTINADHIFSANARAVLLVTVQINEGDRQVTKTFAVTMGYGKYLFNENVIEDDFGLRVVLNTIKPDSLRRINKTNIGGNLKTSNEQLPLKSQIDDFGFDIDRDLIGMITGYSDDEEYAKGMLSGGDLLSLTAEVDITNIVDFLKKTYSKYKLATYKNNFSWVDHIKKVKDTRTIEELDTELVRLMIADSPSIWMAVPEVIEWEEIAGFRYCGRELYDDIDIALIKNSFRNGFTNIEQLKTGRRIVAVSALDGESPYASWSAYKCLYGEVDLHDRSYCINNGRWFCVDRDFVEQVNRDYNSTTVSAIDFIEFTNDYHNENEYSTAFAATDPNHFLCMDRQNVVYGGGQSRIELCDILTNDDTYIHVKPYSGSSTLSHLFNQAVVSAELVLGDLEFRTKANIKIGEKTENEEFLIHENERLNIVFAIISKVEEEHPPIPFFSKVAFRYIKRRLEVFGCTVSIKNVAKH